MKKILYFVCIMLFGFSIKASSAQVDYQEGIYSNRIGNTLYSGQMGFLFLDGELVYCLDPFLIIGKTYEEDNEYINKIKKYNLDYFEMVAYFGYNKTTRNSIYYYMAAQELIWERIIGGANVYWTTGKDGTGQEINIDSYKKEITDDIDNFYYFPSFTDTFHSAPRYESINLYDDNNVLNDFNINYNGNNEIKREDNRLIVKLNSMERQTISFSRKLKTSSKTTIYSSSGNQTLARFGIDMEKNGSFMIQGYSPYRTILNLNFYDKESNEKIKKIDFVLCDKNGQMIDGWINNDGTYTYNSKVDSGKYEVCKIPDEYIGELEFEIDDIDLKENTNINIYLEKKKKESLIIEDIPKLDNEDIIKTNDDILKLDNDVIPIEDILLDNEVVPIKDILLEKKAPINDLILLDSNEILSDKIEEKNIFKFEELPNTYNYDLTRYSILGIIMIIGMILYKNEKIRT